MDLNFSDLANQFRNLDPENIGTWPVVAKAAVVFAICATVLVGGYYLDIQDHWAQFETVQAKEDKLKRDFETKQAKAANLDAYKQQMEEMEESFGTMLRQLPSKTEVAELLVDITQTGLASGLEFSLFQPMAEIPKDFYAELPISIKVLGNYHQFGAFVDGVAALPRIVTLHDIVITRERNPGKGKEARLEMVMTAKTYRYLDESEMVAKKKSKKKGKKR